MEIDGLDASRIIVLDTETTGLRPDKDEILSVSIIDGNGKVLFDQLIKPSYRKRWPDAQKINGISPNDVLDKGTLEYHRNSLQRIINGTDRIVGFNIDFDLKMLRAGGLEIRRVPAFDVMKECTRIHGGKWPRLVELAEMYGYDFEPHKSLNDVDATLYCYKKLLEDSAYVASPEVRLKAAAKATPTTLKGSSNQSVPKNPRKRNGIWMALAILALLCFLISSTTLLRIISAALCVVFFLLWWFA